MSANPVVLAPAKSKKRQKQKKVKVGSSPTVQSSERHWLYSKWVDLVVGCGAWSAPLLLLAYIISQQSNTAVSVAFYALALVFNYPHYMATIYRAYHRREDFAKHKFYTIHLTALLLLAAAFAHYQQSLLPLLFTVYVTWSPWHYTGQNFGLAMMFARRGGARPSSTVRNAFYLSFAASYAVLFLTFHTGVSNDPLVLSFGFPAAFSRILSSVLLLVFVSSGAWSLSRFIKQTSLRAMIAPLTLFLTQALWFVFPSFLWAFNYTQIPQTRYSSGILAVMHSAQYLWVTSYFANRETQASPSNATSANRSAGSRRWKGAGYFFILFVGGIALFVPGPWVVSYLFKFDFGVSFLIVTALVNIHHFILDGTVWKLRDKRVASLLIDGTEPNSAPQADGNPTLAGLMRRLTAHKWLTRSLQAGLAGSLILLAGVDQAKHLYGSNQQNLLGLSKAEALNPFDATVKLQIARAEAKNGDLDKTVNTLQQAIAINPFNSEAQNSLAQLLIQNERFEEAYAHYQQMTRRLPKDVDALINAGILADRFGDTPAAQDYWKRALALDATQKNAWLYLAESAVQGRQPAEAIPYYEQYLGLLTAQQDADKLNVKDVLYLTTRLAELYVQTKDAERALAYYEKTVAFANQSGEKTIESMAYIGLANLYAANDQRSAAAKCYKQAITLDKAAGDKKGEGMNWFNYGQFILAGNSPKRHALACFLKADELLKDQEGTEKEAVQKALKEIASLPEANAAAIRQDVQKASAEALEFDFR